MIVVEVYPFFQEARQRLKELDNDGYTINIREMKAANKDGLQIFVLTQHQLERLNGFNCDRIHFYCINSERDQWTAKMRTKAKNGSVWHHATKIFDWREE